MTAKKQSLPDPQTAYQHVQKYLEEDTTSSQYDPRLAASICLQSSSSEYQAAAATLTAKLVEQPDIDIVPVLYDLLATLDATQPETRIHAMAAIEHVAGVVPDNTDIIDYIVPKLNDPEPLVREAACSALSSLLHQYTRDDELSEINSQTREQLRDGIDPFFIQLSSRESDKNIDWTTSITTNFPLTTYFGQVDAGESRRSYIRMHASSAIGQLALIFPSEIADRSHDLVKIPLEETRAETRGYCIDALGRVEETQQLHSIRDRACEMLDSEETKTDGLSILHSFILESSHLLVDVAPKISNDLDSLERRDRELAVDIILNAAASDDGEIAEPLTGIMKEWFLGEEESRCSAELLAKISVNHPDIVLQPASLAVGLSPEPPKNKQLSVSDCDPTQFDTERAWEMLVEMGKESPEMVWNKLDTDELRSRIESDDTRYAKELFAQIVPPTLFEDALDDLFDQLLAEGPGASSGITTLITRDSTAVAQSACRILQGQDPPPIQVLWKLKRLSSEVPVELASLQPTMWEWNNTIQPSDSRWPALITTIGRCAVATEDHDTITKMLHLEDPQYCRRFLETGISSELIRSDPNESIPPLLQHLSNHRGDLPHKIVRAFVDSPTDYGGWSDTIQDALYECLDDPDKRVRAYAVRALGRRYNSTVQEYLQDLLTTETEPSVRFEAQRILADRRA